jgi:hypothetical protein
MLPQESGDEEMSEVDELPPGGGERIVVDGLRLADGEQIQDDTHLPAETAESAILFPHSWTHVQKQDVPINPISTMHMQYASAGYHMSVRNHGYARWKDGAPMQVRCILNYCMLPHLSMNLFLMRQHVTYREYGTGADRWKLYILER